jgi:hypothetical protein
MKICARCGSTIAPRDRYVYEANGFEFCSQRCADQHSDLQTLPGVVIADLENGYNVVFRVAGPQALVAAYVESYLISFPAEMYGTKLSILLPVDLPLGYVEVEITRAFFQG